MSCYHNNTARNGTVLALWASFRCKTSALPALRPTDPPAAPHTLQASACVFLPKGFEKIAPREEATGN